MPKKFAFDRIQSDLKQAFNGRGLIFTPFHAVDTADFVNFATADEFAMVGGIPHEIDQLAAKFLHVNTRDRAQGAVFNFLVQETHGGPYVAYANIISNPNARTASFGYMVLPSCRKQGIASRMAAAITQGFAEIAPDLGIRQFTASVKDDNVASLRVLEKLRISPRGNGISSFGAPGNFLKYAEPLPSRRSR